MSVVMILILYCNTVVLILLRSAATNVCCNDMYMKRGIRSGPFYLIPEARFLEKG
jgi:hypothetical protein